MNDIVLNWKKIKSFQPEHERFSEDRPYLHEEIKAMIEASDLRNKAIILLMSSSGVRVGALPDLRVKDLELIEPHNIFRIKVYAKSRKSYFSFCTPECATVLNQYLDHRRRFGENVTGDSPLFRLDFNATDPTPASLEVKPITRKTIQQNIFYLWQELGFNQVQNGHQRRNHIMKCHGFRKFFETNAFKAGMDHIYIRRLMGQKAGLEDSYLKIPEQDLLEGDSMHVGYMGIMDQLTISEENRLRKENQILKVRVDKLDQVMQDYKEIKEKLGI